MHFKVLLLQAQRFWKVIWAYNVHPLAAIIRNWLKSFPFSLIFRQRNVCMENGSLALVQRRRFFSTWARTVREKHKPREKLGGFWEEFYVHSSYFTYIRTLSLREGNDEGNNAQSLEHACLITLYNVYDKFAERRVIQNFLHGETFSCKTMQHKIALFRSVAVAVILNSLGSCLCGHKEKKIYKTFWQ